MGRARDGERAPPAHPVLVFTRLFSSSQPPAFKQARPEGRAEGQLSCGIPPQVIKLSVPAPPLADADDAERLNKWKAAALQVRFGRRLMRPVH